MMIPLSKRPWAKKQVPPVVAYGFLLVSIVLSLLVWRVLLSPKPDTEAVIVPGSLPKKAEIIEEPKKEEEPVEEKPSTPAPASVYPEQLSAAEAGSLTVVVNKKHRLPSDYIPSTINARGANMRPEAASALEEMFLGAELDGHAPKVISSYRSYATQVSVYNGYVAQYGQAQADTFSARPGHSEHQTGLAVDVGNVNGSCDLEICFGSTALGEWIKVNAHLYGYIVRYPEGKEALTGYQYEPWHLRYVGVEIAEKIIRTGVTLDQYFNIPAGGY